MVDGGTLVVYTKQDNFIEILSLLRETEGIGPVKSGNRCENITVLNPTDGSLKDEVKV